MSELLKGRLGFKGQKGDTGEVGTPVPYNGTFDELKNSNESKLYNYIILDSSDTEYEGHWVYYDRKASEWKDGGMYLSHYLTNEMRDWIARQTILEQKYDEQIKNLANSEPQLPEIVDARNGFDTLGSIINQKVYHFDTIKAMMECSNLNAGDVVRTLGANINNDGAGGQYRIVNDASLTADGYTILDLENGLKAIKIFENEKETVLNDKMPFYPIGFINRDNDDYVPQRRNG